LIDFSGVFVGTFGELSKVLLKAEEPQPKAGGGVAASAGSTQANRLLEGFYEELPLVKKVPLCNTLTVSVRKSPESAQKLVHLETDLPGDVVVHWGVCQDGTKKWEVPPAPHPSDTEIFKNKALRTRLQVWNLIYWKTG